MDPRALDDIIERLIWNDDNQLTEQDIRDLCARATVIFLDEPSLIDFNLEGDPIKICGDIHGQFSDLLQIFNYGGHPSATNNYLFLGNYVDGGEQSVETVCLLLAYKIRYPENFFLLRGNHEIADINRNRGFYDECKSKFSRRLWRVFNDCFNCLPVAALISEKVFCVHAGLSPYLNDLIQIENIRRPTDVPENGLLCDLLWSDPSCDVQGWAMNISRGCSYTFGQDIVSQFLQKHDLDHIIRAHEVVADGYEFFGDGRLVTVYSAPNYCGEGNAGAIITIDESLLCSFQVLKPEEEGTNFNFSLTGETGTSDFTGEPVAGVKLLQPSNNKEMRWGENFPPPAELVLPTSGGYGSTLRRKSEDTRVKPSFRAFSPKEIQDATNNLSESLIIGHTGYGKIYKCQLDNWDVAVKILDDQSDQGDKEYVKEKEVLEVMRHENIIHLMGTCFILRALVYEYLPNGSLEDYLKDRPWELTRKIRTRIVYEICTALRFLHANKPPLVHGDLNPHSVLLGANFKVKLADFGLCHYLTQGENSKAFCQTVHASGSLGYMDPDYLDSGKVTPGVDVYSFGKTVVRILTGQYPPDIFSEVHAAKRRGSFMSIVDPTVRDWSEDVVETLARFALRSIKPDRNRSEFMGNFHSELEMLLDENLLCSFQVMTPKEEGTNFNFSITRTSETGKPVAGVKPHQPSDNKEMKRGENFPPPTTGGYGSTFRRKSKDTRVKPSFKPFSPEEIQDATNNFSESLLIGKGGYGKVYKCKLDNWDVAVKILDDKSDQGLKEYIKEMEVLERMRHENLIHLMGTCFKFCALVYEYLPNGSLEDCLTDRPGKLTWEIRTRIVYEICTALGFLHVNKPEPLVHGDLKPANVLLGANFKVKLADFGLCRYLNQGKNSKAYRQTSANGSPGYMDPNYLEFGELTSGADVYSLGKTVVRILTGKQPLDIFKEMHEANKRGSLMTIVDPTIRDWPEDVVETLAHFALKARKSDRYRPEFIGKFYSELEKILDGIDN